MEVLHFGINAKNAADAEEISKVFGTMFDFVANNGNASIFTADKKIEIVKENGRGKHGHICLGTHDIEKDIAALESKGLVFDEASAKFKNEKLASIYIKEEIAGFAVHLMSY